MSTTSGSREGVVVAPHRLAAQAGRDVLREGGHAVEAMVAAAAVIAVVYPHMNALGGDGFWLLHHPGQEPQAIDASGWAAALATPGFYAGMERIPARGPQAALTVAGTVGGWALALELARPWGRASLPLERLLRDAIRHARMGVAVTASQAELTRRDLVALRPVPGFAEAFLVSAQAPEPGSLLRQVALGDTLAGLAERGLDDFYRGRIGRSIAAELEKLGSPLRAADLRRYAAHRVAPLSLRLRDCRLYNLPPPSQGLASLLILGVFERLGVERGEGFAHVHGLVEATKRAFCIRDRAVADRGRVQDPARYLGGGAIDALAAQIDPRRASPWPAPGFPGDTVWMGAIDRQGRAVSFIQSVYWGFGTGVVLHDTGITWHNRGVSFSLRPGHLNRLEPGCKPLHTLNPALARFDDGRVMAYGAMGGDGQPQTQAAVFTRYARFGQALDRAVSAPRWLLGRTWGDASTQLMLECRFAPELVQALRDAGHDVQLLDQAFSELMGHAGAVVRHPDGRIEGAADPRSDGAAAGV